MTDAQTREHASEQEINDAFDAWRDTRQWPKPPWQFMGWTKQAYDAWRNAKWDGIGRYVPAVPEPETKESA